MKPLPPDARILAIAVARIGDTLLVTPALAALKALAPAGRLTCLAHPKRLEILQHLPFIDRLGPITKQRAPWLGRLSGKRYDLAVVWGKDAPLIRYALRAAHQVIAFRQEDASINESLAACVEWPATEGHAVDHRLSLLAPLAPPAAGRRLRYAASAAETSWARGWLRQACGRDGVLPVCMQTASFPTKAYRDWPEASFRELGERLLARDPRIVLVLLGDRGDRERAARIAAALGPRALCAAGDFTLRQSAAMLSLAGLYVGVDTGITHVAGALGLPMVALYHCAHPGRYLAPLEHPAPLEVIEQPLPPGGCSTAAGMDAISVDRVWDAAQRVLAQAASRDS
ncbi:MAG TPA: glycosyltransferase family 9 protein [Rhodocyclaceae bacterium]